MQRLTLAKRTTLLFFLAAAIFYFYGLGHYPFLGPDEPRYAQVAREMYLRGDMITPTLGGHTWFEKPALLYWMIMAGYRLFGVSEWAARVGPALCGLLTILMIYWVGRRVEDASEDKEETSRLGLLSGVCAASSLGLVVFSRATSFDIVVTMTMTLALACFFLAELTEKRRRLLLAGFYAAIGASLIAKGLVGIVVPVGVIGLYHLLRRKWPARAIVTSALWGIPLTVAVAALWYAPVIARHGWTFVDEFFIQHHFARYVSNKYHHPQRFYFYLPIIALLTLPWTAFLVAQLAGVRRWSWRSESATSKFRIFALAWFIAPIVFFSFSGSKLPAYVLPALPGAALLAGERLSRFVRSGEGNRAMITTGAILFTLALAGVLYAVQSGDLTVQCALLITLPLALAGALAMFWTRRRLLRIELVLSAIFISLALALNCAVDRISHRESVRDLIALADARGYSSTPVFYMLTDDRTGEFYAGGRLGYRQDGEPFRFDGADEAAEEARRNGGVALIFIPSKWENQLTDYSPIETEIIGRTGVLSLVLIRLR